MSRALLKVIPSNEDRVVSNVPEERSISLLGISPHIQCPWMLAGLSHSSSTLSTSSHHYRTQWEAFASSRAMQICSSGEATRCASLHAALTPNRFPELGTQAPSSIPQSPSPAIPILGFSPSPLSPKNLSGSGARLNPIFTGRRLLSHNCGAPALKPVVSMQYRELIPLPAFCKSRLTRLHLPFCWYVSCVYKRIFPNATRGPWGLRICRKRNNHSLTYGPNINVIHSHAKLRWQADVSGSHARFNVGSRCPHSSAGVHADRTTMRELRSSTFPFSLILP
ncbi:hypothetical protein FN846DRAFT_45615 [Sphaerosporella brunnea]|uniref:Uncharacterized protein n=1 Tax=Sphaerosporella brunnea TaxID=1250544 RepID=A0A5J5EUK8_9PEZI|nr:hypothetical protein FN846DRAFT_45615 [Sphaerosporella brunnea]